jgi:hypothetical protein
MGDNNSDLRAAEFLERHYTLGELSESWHMSLATLRAWFINEPGVIKFGTAKLNKGRKRVYVSLRVPESVARRVYRRRTSSDIQPAIGSRK